MRGRSTVAGMALLVMTAACGPGSGQLVAPPAAGATASHATVEELIAAVLARARADHFVTETITSSVVVNGEVMTDAAGTSESHYGTDGVTSRSRSHDRAAGARFPDTELLVFPDEAYLTVKAGGSGPYLRLDSAATDPLSEGFGQVASSVRRGQAFCGTELGRATITDVTSAEFDGRPVLRYLLTVDLNGDAVVPALNEYYRRLGLTSFRISADVDREDRLLHCVVDEDLPGGSGSLRTDDRMSRFGERVVIERPAAGRIVVTPPASWLVAQPPA